MSRARKKPPAVLVPPLPERRRHGADVLGDVELLHDFRLEGASSSTMLVRAISPWEGDAVVTGGLSLAADELAVLITAFQADGADLDGDLMAHVLAGIENRLRVLGEIARRLSEPTEATP